jgi:HK97 family phage major capsid protein
MMDRTAAGVLVPEELSYELINGVSQKSAVMSLARRLGNMATNKERMPLLDALPTAGYTGGEGLRVPVTEAAYKDVYIYAEPFGALVVLQRDVVEDILAGNFSLLADMKDRVVESFGKAVDAAVLYGDRKPASWPTALVSAAVAKSRSVALGTNDDIAEDVNSLMGLVEADGLDVTGFLAGVQLKSTLRGLRDANGNPIFVPSLTAGAPGTLYGNPIHYLRNGAWNNSTAKLLAGDWEQLMYSWRQDITMKILDQAVVQDTEGNIAHNLAQENKLGLMFYARIGVALPITINAMNQDRSAIYPFAALTPAA